MKKTLKILLAIMLSLTFLVGCESKKYKIGYTVYPIKFLLERIGSDKVETFALSSNENIMRATLNDDYESILKEVDALFTIGDLEPYAELIVEDIKDYNTNVIELGAKSSIIAFKRYTNVFVDDQSVGVESNYYENPLFEDVNTYTNDPFIWLDPIIMTSMANQVLDYFITIDPDNTSYYRTNFNKLKMDLAYLDANFLKLRSGDNLSLATMLPAFGMYENNYGFLISPIILSKYGNLPTNKQLEIIKVRLINDKAEYLIVEDDLADDILDLAGSLSNELGLEIVKIDSLTHLSEAKLEVGLDYISIMNDNLSKLEELKNRGSIVIEDENEDE